MMSALRQLTYFGTTKLAAWSLREAISDIRPRGWNPIHWLGNSQQAYAIDKKIDQYNQRQWAKNPDPTSNSPVLVNRGSTHVRNGHLHKLNLEGARKIPGATAIDLLDAWHRDPETTHLAPPSIGPAPWFVNKGTSMGVPNPFGYPSHVGRIWLQPDAGMDTFVHEAGHNRSYGTRPSGSVLKDGLKYIFQRPVATMRMEDLAEDNGWRLNSFMNPESRMTPETWARHSDEVLRDYTKSHDPQNRYSKSMVPPTSRLGNSALPTKIDGRTRYTPPKYSGLPGQPNWHRSEHYRSAE